MSYVAPAGTPIAVSLYMRSLLRGLRSGADDSLARALAAHSGHTQGLLFSTGRAAMVIALEALREIAADPRRTEVIVAGYTCYSVPASVLRAGLHPRLCDVDPRTLSLNLDDLARFDMSKVLAIVSANLYGMPNDMARLESLARDAGVYLLDDAAQALGARLQGRPIGGFGNIGLYSFDKGKNITSLEGGALVTSDESLTRVLTRRWTALPRVPAPRVAITAAKLAAYSLLLRPALYGLVHKLPFLGLGKTAYEDDYPLLRYPQLLAGFAHSVYERLPQLTAARRANADSLRQALRANAALEPVPLLPDAEAGYTRLPVLVRDPAKRAQFIAALEGAGFGATASYPAALADVPELVGKLNEEDRRAPGARQVAQRIMTLPVHPYCPPGYAARVAQVLESASAAQFADARLQRL
jgi:perosamine synthetase